MANTFKYTAGGPVIDNKVTVPFSSIGQDGSGQGSQGTRTFLSPNHVRIVDVNSNTRQTHLINDLTPGKEYTVSVEYLKITGAPTFRFQIQGYTDNTYRRTIKFTNTEETGLRDIDGWQTATWTFSLASNENAVRIWWQDGADYTTYTHSFELRYPALRESHMGTSSHVGDWSIGVNGAGMGPTSTGGFRKGAEIPEGGYAIYSEGPRVRTVANDEELMTVLNKMGASLPVDSLGDGLQWAKDNNVLVVDKPLTSTKKDSVALELDTRYTAGYFQQVPVVNALSSGDPDLNNLITWTNSGAWTFTDNASDIEPPFTNGANGAKIMRGQSNTTGSQHFGCASFNGPASTTFTISVWYRQNRAGATRPYFRTKVNNNSLIYFNYNGSTNTSSWPVDEWIRISATATLQSNETGAYLSNYLGGQKGDTVWYYAPMVELGSTMSPFVNGTRTQNSTLIDLSGKSNNGTINGEVVFDSTGAISFDGATNHVQVDSHPAFNVDERTIEITFKMNSSYGNYTPLAVYANGSSSTNRLWLGLQSGKFQMHGWGTTDPGATTTINVGEWYTCTFSYSNSTKEMKMYTNGKLERTMQNSQDGILAQDGMNWYLAHMPGGESWAGGLTHSDVTIQSFRVHDRILSDEEVAQNYYEGPISINKLAHTWDAGNITSHTEDVLVKDMSGSINGNMIANSRVNNYGGYWRFTGDDNWILLDGSTDSFRLNQGDYWTVNTWIRTGVNGGATGDQPIMSNSQSGPVWSVFKVHNNRIGYSHYNNAWITTTGNKVITDNQWHMLTWVNKGDGTMDMYVDGGLDAQGVDGALSADNRIDIIGASWGGRFNGDIAMVQVNRASLTQEEVLQNYNAHVTRFK